MDDSLFEVSNEIELPNNIEMVDDLISTEIEDVLTGETIKNVLLKKESSLLVPYYLLDLREAKEITGSFIDALKSFIVDEGDTNFYIQTEEKVLSRGKINRTKDYLLFKTVLDSLLGDKFKLYLDIGNGLERVFTEDVRSVRLGL